MPVVRIRLAISPEQFLEWYRGTARDVIARTDESLTVQFPANVLQRFVTPEGIHGQFLLTFDDHHRFVRIERIDPTSDLDQIG
jgi:hypothetical protein